MRTGRSYSPRTLVSNFIWLSTMPGCWRHVAQGRMESLLVVMLHEVGDDPFGLQIIITVIVVALIAYGAVEAFDDAVRFRVSGPRFDIDQVMRLDRRGDVAIDELTAMIVYNARFDAL